MKRPRARLAEVQLQPLPRPAAGPRLAADAAFAVSLPTGATGAVPAGFDPEELLSLLTVLREAGQ